MNHRRPTIQLGELCRRLNFPYRDARYVLEQGFLPRGVEPKPDRGHHRQLTPAQAFWLAIVLSLKRSALKTPLAAQIAEFARLAIRGISQNAAWDFRFSPFDGDFETQHKWFIDVGDLTFVRVVTDANPSHKGLFAFPWSYIDSHAQAEDVAPIVMIRLDIGRIARLLNTPSVPEHDRFG